MASLLTITTTIDAIETALANRASAAGLVSVSIDGTTTNYSWDDAVKMLNFWRKELARVEGKRSLVNSIDLRGQ